jgi:hypothetical protein
VFYKNKQMNETKIYFEILQAKSDYSEEFTPLILTLFWDISFSILIKELFVGGGVTCYHNCMLTHDSVWQGKQNKKTLSLG